MGKRFVIPLDFEFSKKPVSLYYLHKDLIVTIELKKVEKVMLCSDDAAATFTISNIALEYDAIIDAGYTEKVSRAQQESLYPYTMVTRLSYQQLSKKDATWLLDQKLQAKSLQGLLLLYNPTTKKVNITINGNPHQLFKVSILPHNMYLQIARKFLEENSDASFKDYISSKYGL